jgi:hypothetical protein
LSGCSHISCYSRSADNKKSPALRNSARELKPGRFFSNFLRGASHRKSPRQFSAVSFSRLSITSSPDSKPATHLGQHNCIYARLNYVAYSSSSYGIRSSAAARLSARLSVRQKIVAAGLLITGSVSGLRAKAPLTASSVAEAKLTRLLPASSNVA